MKATAKKTAAGILAAITVLTVGTAGALAVSSGRNFQDADGDGICDLYDTAGSGQGLSWGDADGDGICDRSGSTCRRVDGVCGQGCRAVGMGRGFRGGR